MKRRRLESDDPPPPPPLIPIHPVLEVVLRVLLLDLDVIGRIAQTSRAARLRCLADETWWRWVEDFLQSHPYLRPVFAAVSPLTRAELELRYVKLRNAEPPQRGLRFVAEKCIYPFMKVSRILYELRSRHYSYRESTLKKLERHPTLVRKPYVFPLHWRKSLDTNLRLLVFQAILNEYASQHVDSSRYTVVSCHCVWQYGWRGEEGTVHFILYIRSGRGELPDDDTPLFRMLGDDDDDPYLYEYYDDWHEIDENHFWIPCYIDLASISSLLIKKAQ